jgi:hypothetical protein
LLTTPVAAASMPAFPSGVGNKNAEDAPIKNGESAEVQTRGAGEGGDIPQSLPVLVCSVRVQWASVGLGLTARLYAPNSA